GRSATRAGAVSAPEVGPAAGAVPGGPSRSARRWGEVVLRGPQGRAEQGEGGVGAEAGAGQGDGVTQVANGAGVHAGGQRRVEGGGLDLTVRPQAVGFRGVPTGVAARGPAVEGDLVVGETQVDEADPVALNQGEALAVGAE